MGLFSEITRAVGNVVEGAVATVGNVANVVVTTVDGGSTRQALAQTASDVTKVNTSLMDVATLGQGDKLDAVTGGLFSATKSAQQTTENLIAGKSVRQNLEDAARVGATIGAGIATGGSSFAVQAGTTMAVNKALINPKTGKSDINIKNIFGAAGAAGTGNSFVDNIFKSVGASNDTSPRAVNNTGATQSGYFSDSPTDIFQSADKNFVLPLIIGISLIVTIIVIKKKH